MRKIAKDVSIGRESLYKATINAVLHALDVKIAIVQADTGRKRRHRKRLKYCCFVE